MNKIDQIRWKNFRKNNLLYIVNKFLRRMEFEIIMEIDTDTKEVTRVYPRQIKDIKYHSKLECFVLNIIDFRFWFCECHYYSPYGLCISGGCKKHD